MIRTQRHHGIVAMAAALLLTVATAPAGPIFFAGRMADGAFVPNAEVKTPFYETRFSAITATIDGDAARTEIHETLVGPDRPVSTVCIVPLPAGARATLEVVDREAAPEARLLTADEAQTLYEAIARGTDSVAVLGLTGRPALWIDGFTLHGKTELILRIEQAVRTDRGVRSLTCPTPATTWTDRPVGRLAVTATIRTAKPLRAVFSPTHEVTIERHGLHKAVARVRADRWTGGEDLRLCWVADRDPLGLRVVACRNEADDDGYFMLVGNPTGSADEKPVAKDVLFVLDTSGSMRGEKVEQARAAIDYCLGRLGPADRFNIITFGTEVAGFCEDLVAADAKQIAAAREFADGVVARGRTNIGGALATARAARAEPGRPRIMIFLTDGTPTAGERVPDQIVEAVRATDTTTQIFVMGVGHDVNAHLLDKLAEITNGSAEYVAPREEIDVKMAALYDRLSQPVLTDVTVAFGGLAVHSVYPAKVPALFRGSDITVVGRYRGGGTHTVSVSGTMGGKPVTYACTADLPVAAADPAHEFVAPLWAARKIGYLLQELRLHGENQELIEEVVRLSQKYGIVTEYTEFIAVAGGKLDKAAALAEASRRMEMANAMQAGQWAVNQAINDRGLQQRMVAADSANVYRDRLGREVANTAVRNFGRQVFYLRDGQWVDAEEAGDRKTRTVKLYSDEYFRLLRANADFARAQKLGWAVAMNVGAERIVVEKDGKLKDEALQRQAPPPEPTGEQLRNGMNQRQQFRNQIQQLPVQKLQGPRQNNDAHRKQEEQR